MKNLIIFICAIFLAGVIVSCGNSGVSDSEVLIPAGSFNMGSDEEDEDALGREFGLRSGSFYEDEQPMRRVTLKGYYIDKFEVTNERYKGFVSATGYKAPSNWTEGTYPAERGEHPVSHVTWFDADGFCKWDGRRLPSEAEWEKAAHGPDGYVYPWGNEYDESKTNVRGGKTMVVGSIETDKSGYGVYDMAGNVMEWVDDWYMPYPGSTAKNKDFGYKVKVLRGASGSTSGHYNIAVMFARASSRQKYLPSGADKDGGFRCARDIDSSAKK